MVPNKQDVKKAVRERAYKEIVIIEILVWNWTNLARGTLAARRCKRTRRFFFFFFLPKIQRKQRKVKEPMLTILTWMQERAAEIYSHKCLKELARGVCKFS